MVPKFLQGVLWSASVDDLDLQKNENYIIHQILAYGTWEHLLWLLKNYPREQIKEVFVKHPEKDYSPACFNFTKNILLDLGDIQLNKNLYFRSAPRNATSHTTTF